MKTMKRALLLNSLFIFSISSMAVQSTEENATSPKESKVVSFTAGTAQEKSDDLKAKIIQAYDLAPASCRNDEMVDSGLVQPLGEPEFNRSANKFNDAVLNSIYNITKNEPEGAGYDPENGPAMSVPLKISKPDGTETVLHEGGGNSYCSGATFAGVIGAYNYYDPSILSSMRPEQLEGLTWGHDDDVGASGAWNRDGPGNQALNFMVPGALGEVDIDVASLCPGDSMNFNWDDGGGHSTIFLYQNESEFCYWSSNKATNGYGVQCSPKSRIENTNFLRVTHPENIAGIEDFKAGQKYTQYFDAKKPIPSAITSGGGSEQYWVDNNSHYPNGAI